MEIMVKKFTLNRDRIILRSYDGKEDALTKEYFKALNLQPKILKQMLMSTFKVHATHDLLKLSVKKKKYIKIYLPFIF